MTARRRSRLMLAAAGLAVVASGACATTRPASSPDTIAAPIDADATAETRALFQNLRALAGRGILFGHEGSLAYGVHWRYEPGRSDVRETAGSYPAVYGWDVNMLLSRRPGDPTGAAARAALRRWIAEGYGRGGVITMAWHADNPVSRGNAWDTTRAVEHLLPGGSHHAAYRARLDTVAEFFSTLRARGPDGRETLVPVVFRPFHEMGGSWFWWGGRHRSAEQFVALWRFTVEYLRDRRGVHNLLYAYSTDVFDSKDDYLRHYPGDAWVDLLGFDDYQSVRTPATRAVLVRRLRDVVELADARGKLAAVTETGVETVPDSLWWTRTLLPALLADSVTRRVSWVLAWRNANRLTDRPDHFYAPYAGHPSAADFKRFRDHPMILFEDELPPLYGRATPRTATPR
ncbi:MAG TPA: glycosyl hydrolase [Gemmatimonadaceae bacterium]|nr:glycosyl hydrolase [Gemmatimonadaceae bacterium]